MVLGLEGSQKSRRRRRPELRWRPFEVWRQPDMATLAGALVALVFVVFLRAPGASAGDAECLADLKNSVSDPSNSFAAWTNSSSICNWPGVTCFSHDLPPVYGLDLSGRGLTGAWPAGLAQCAALQKIDLSSNSFTGPIPSTLCSDVPNLVYLDISHNSLGGAIPPGLAGCKYMNDLLLEDNQLEGEIPAELGLIERLVVFNVSDNQLDGNIPTTLVNRTAVKQSGFNGSSFAGNPYLCGPPLTGTCRHKKKAASASLGAILGAAVGGAFLLAALAALLLWFVAGRARTADAAALRDESKWARRIRKPKAVTVSMFEKPIVRIRLSDLMAATRDFSPDGVIGSGRTGTVYRAAFPDGSVMAIKRLQPSAHSDRQFKAEMETLGRLRHRNLVPLLGYCIAGNERLLVYKHMPHGSVAARLRPRPAAAAPQPPLDWPERVKIATGAARGLAWLHHRCTPRVIHRNVSAAAVLLDDDNEPRITDFGLARLMDPVDTHVSTRVNGDFGDVGYVAPEYLRTLVATTKGDVYSFGVVLLELVTGRGPVDAADAAGLPPAPGFKGNLVDYVLLLSNASRVADGVDPFLRDKGVDDEVMQVFKVATSCVLVGAKERPSMFEIYQLLRAIGHQYNYTDPFDDLPDLSSHGGGGDAAADEVIVSVK